MNNNVEYRPKRQKLFHGSTKNNTGFSNNAALGQEFKNFAGVSRKKAAVNPWTTATKSKLRDVRTKNDLFKKYNLSGPLNVSALAHDQRGSQEGGLLNFVGAPFDKKRFKHSFGASYPSFLQNVGGSAITTKDAKLKTILNSTLMTSI